MCLVCYNFRLVSENNLKFLETVASDRGAMKLAIEAAWEGIKKGQSPFGSCIVKNGRVLACAHNGVWESTNPTSHSEMNAIQGACRMLGTIDLSGCVLFATCEPCPMCYSAAHWARISKIVFGAKIKDAQLAGFNEMEIPAERMKEMSEDKIEFVSGFMEKECRRLFSTWYELGKGKPY